MYKSKSISFERLNEIFDYKKNNGLKKTLENFKISEITHDKYLQEYKKYIKYNKLDNGENIVYDEINELVDSNNAKINKQKYTQALKEIELLNKKIKLYESITENNYKEIKIETRKHNHGTEATAILLRGDEHIEEEVLPATVNGLNEYNLDIMRQRYNNITTGALRLIEIQRAGVEINKLVIALLGDHINGYLRDENLETNKLSPTQAILTILEQIISSINYLLKNGKFDEIIIPCSYGNHGRTTEKPRCSTGYKNSYEWMMFCLLANHYKDNKKVKFIISESIHTYYSIYDLQIRQSHGDAIKYNGGIGDINVPINKAINQWNKARKVDLDIMGHWHSLKEDKNFIVNGSLIGHNAYSIRIKAGYDVPKQLLFLIDNKRGKTISMPIFC